MAESPRLPSMAEEKQVEPEIKKRMNRRARRAIVLAAIAWLPGQLPAYGQSVEDQARIDYESAKLAFVKGDFKLALSKVESVMRVLGPDPNLLTFAAGAAFENRDVPGARDYAKRAYAAADPMFKGSESYQQLIALSARIELEGPAIEKASPEAILGSAARWTSTYDSLCNKIFYPYSPTYKVRARESSRTPDRYDRPLQREYVDTVVAIEKESVTVRTEYTKWSSGFPPDTSTNRLNCDESGILYQVRGSMAEGWQSSGYQNVADLRLGSEWENEKSKSTHDKQRGLTFDSAFRTLCTTEGAEDVNVTAGDFRALRVVCLESGTVQTRDAQRPGQNDTSSIAITTTYWYAPGVGQVKIVASSQSSGTEHVWELLEFTP